jgi:hypothetical protein
MSLVWGLGAHYLWTDPGVQQQMPVLDVIRDKSIQTVQSAFFLILSNPDPTAIQISILLGSFYLFNGKPHLGLGILGSGIKSAQAIGLHRRPRCGNAISLTSKDHHRIWWALEIFDK